jgi:hypothetical protein
MHSRFLINALLVIFGSLLLSLIWLTQETDSKSSIHLTTLDPAAIQTISIQRQKKEALTLVKSNGQWRLNAPFSARALSGKIERLLKISQIKAIARYPMLEEKKKLYGLVKPHAQISYNDTTISIGKTNPVAQRRYVSDGRYLYLVDDTFLHHLTANTTDYVDTLLFENTVSPIRIQTESFTLSQQADFTWINEDDPSELLAADSVQMLLDEWRFARAMRVLKMDGQLSESEITLTLENGQERIFDVYKLENTVVLQANESGLGYEFSTEKYALLTSLITLEEDN